MMLLTIINCVINSYPQLIVDKFDEMLINFENTNF